MAHFPANVFHEITVITDALNKNAHDQNEQTILRYSSETMYTSEKTKSETIELNLASILSESTLFGIRKQTFNRLLCRFRIFLQNLN